MLSELEQIESVASFALEHPDNKQVAADFTFCERFLGLFRPAQYQKYLPSKVFKPFLADWVSDSEISVQIESTPDCTGDVELILRCLSVLLDSVVLEDDSTLVVEVFEEAGTPCMALSFDGFGCFPEVLTIGGLFSIRLEALGERWTLATRGGRIDAAPNGLLLRLTGARLPVESQDAWEPLRLACLKASSDPSAVQIEQVLRFCAPLEESPQPADVNGVFTEMLRVQADSLSKLGIQLILSSNPPLPPVPVYRSVMRRLLARFGQLAEKTLSHGGRVSATVMYDTVGCWIDLDYSMEGVLAPSGDTYLLASLKRAVRLLQGELGISESARKITYSVQLPDFPGQALEAWIPGYGVFSEKSRQILRLLKTAESPMPEPVFLAGILDEELTAWLLPYLSTPKTRNLAYDLMADIAGLTNGNKVRQEKALEQIRKGKPRKEIAKPPYAGEVLYAYRLDLRHREAVGCGLLDEAPFVRLCQFLTQSPVNALECLRLVAQARRACS